ncbi:WD40 repeat domain-containing protein, partial [Actinoallomurus sp. NPDC052274]|uniref:NACHT and WD repeat domain-containing protein n=1 Tax=Actinoallomurus sp. NPDC052274 TaxID=3155420 RepID=UPI00343B721F
MNRRAPHDLQAGTFVLGLLIGFGTNLLTADPQRWPRVLQPVNDYAPEWTVALVAGVLGARLIGHWRSRGARSWSGDGNPYPGLEAYGPDRAAVFFGRDQEIGVLVDRLSRRSKETAARFVAVIGPSGSGKSSLVRAGVVPALERRGWITVGPILPGADPVAGLAAAMTPQALEWIADLRRESEEALAALTDTGPPYRPRTLCTLTRALSGGDHRLLLIIDQLEECVSLCTPQQRDAFLALLGALLTWDPRVSVVVTLRFEFLGTFQEGSTPHLFSEPFGIGRLSPAGLRKVINGPADAAGVALDDGLVDLMVREASGNDALPLTGYVLEQLYERHGGSGRITINDYERAGGVAGAVARHADHVLAELEPRHGTDRVLETLLRFITWQGVQPTRRRVRRSELDIAALDIVERFRDARLMVDVEDSFDLAHEALLRQWEPLAQLARAHESELRRRTELEPLALTWDHHGRDDGYLLFGEYLHQARDVMSNEGVSPLVGEFVRTSLLAESFRRRRLADQLAGHSLRLRFEDPQLAMALAYTAIVECSATPSAGHALRSALRHSMKLTLRGHQDWIRSLAWSADGHLASACDDGTVRIWDVESGDASVLLGHMGWVRSVAWSPDGRLASAGEDGTVRVWDADGTPKKVLRAHEGPVRSVAWSPDGRLASGGEDGTVRVWDADGTPKKV